MTHLRRENKLYNLYFPLQYFADDRLTRAINKQANILNLTFADLSIFLALIDLATRDRCSTLDQRRPRLHRHDHHKRHPHSVSWHRRAVHRHLNRLIHKSHHHRGIIVPPFNVISASSATRWMKSKIWLLTRHRRLCKYQNWRIGKLDLIPFSILFTHVWRWKLLV